MAVIDNGLLCQQISEQWRTFLSTGEHISLNQLEQSAISISPAHPIVSPPTYLPPEMQKMQEQLKSVSQHSPEWLHHQFGVHVYDRWHPWHLYSHVEAGPNVVLGVDAENDTQAIAQIIHGMPHQWQFWLDQLSEEQLNNPDCLPEMKEFLQQCRHLRSLRESGSDHHERMQSVAEHYGLGLQFVPATLCPALNSVAERDEPWEEVEEASEALTGAARSSVHSCQEPPIRLRSISPSTSPEDRAAELVKRPPNAWIVYRAEYHKIVTAIYPKLRNGDISRIVSRLWAKEDPDVKQSYKTVSREIAEIHRTRFPNYKYHPRKSHERKRRAPRTNKNPAANGAVQDAANQIFALMGK